MISRATEAGVTEIISIGTRVESSARAVELAENFPNIWATVGIHPCDADEAPDDAVERIRALAQSSRVVALGEIGLDYHRLPENAAEAARNKERQANLFRAQLELAVELGLNAVIHQRDSWDDTLRILGEFTGRVRGVFHCFGGTLAQANDVIALGHLVSFTGIVTFKNARQVQETAQDCRRTNSWSKPTAPISRPHRIAASAANRRIRGAWPISSRSCAANRWKRSPRARPRQRGSFSVSSEARGPKFGKQMSIVLRRSCPPQGRLDKIGLMGIFER